MNDQVPKYLLKMGTSIEPIELTENRVVWRQDVDEADTFEGFNGQADKVRINFFQDQTSDFEIIYKIPTSTHFQR